MFFTPRFVPVKGERRTGAMPNPSPRFCVGNGTSALNKFPISMPTFVASGSTLEVGDHELVVVQLRDAHASAARAQTLQHKYLH